MAVMNYFLKSKKEIGINFVDYIPASDGFFAFETEETKIVILDQDNGWGRLHFWVYDTATGAYPQIISSNTPLKIRMVKLPDSYVVEIEFNGVLYIYNNVRLYEFCGDGLINDNYNINFSEFPYINTGNIRPRYFSTSNGRFKLHYTDKDIYCDNWSFTRATPITAPIIITIFNNFDCITDSNWWSNVTTLFYEQVGYHNLLSTFSLLDNPNDYWKAAGYQYKEVPEPVPPAPEIDEYYTSNLKLAMLGNCVNEYNARWSS